MSGSNKGLHKVQVITVNSSDGQSPSTTQIKEEPDEELCYNIEGLVFNFPPGHEQAQSQNQAEDNGNATPEFNARVQSSDDNIFNSEDVFSVLDGNFASGSAPITEIKTENGVAPSAANRVGITYVPVNAPAYQGSNNGTGNFNSSGQPTLNLMVHNDPNGGIAQYQQYKLASNEAINNVNGGSQNDGYNQCNGNSSPSVDAVGDNEAGSVPKKGKGRGRKPKCVKDAEVAASARGAAKQTTRRSAKEKREEAALTQAAPNVVVHHRAASSFGLPGMSQQQLATHQQQPSSTLIQPQGQTNMSYSFSGQNNNFTGQFYTLENLAYQDRNAALARRNNSSEVSMVPLTRTASMRSINGGENGQGQKAMSFRLVSQGEIVQQNPQQRQLQQQQLQQQIQPQQQRYQQQVGRLEQLISSRISEVDAAKRPNMMPSVIQRNKVLYAQLTAPKKHCAFENGRLTTQDKWMQCPNPTITDAIGAGTSSNNGGGTRADSTLYQHRSLEIAQAVTSTCGSTTAHIQYPNSSSATVNVAPHQQQSYENAGQQCEPMLATGENNQNLPCVVANQGTQQNVTANATQVGSASTASARPAGRPAGLINNSMFKHFYNLSSKHDDLAQENNELKMKCLYLYKFNRHLMNRVRVHIERNEQMKIQNDQLQMQMTAQLNCAMAAMYGAEGEGMDHFNHGPYLAMDSMMFQAYPMTNMLANAAIQASGFAHPTAPVAPETETNGDPPYSFTTQIKQEPVYPDQSLEQNDVSESIQQGGADETNTFRPITIKREREDDDEVQLIVESKKTCVTNISEATQNFGGTNGIANNENFASGGFENSQDGATSSDENANKNNIRVNLYPESFMQMNMNIVGVPKNESNGGNESAGYTLGNGTPTPPSSSLTDATELMSSGSAESLNTTAGVAGSINYSPNPETPGNQNSQ